MAELLSSLERSSEEQWRDAHPEAESRDDGEEGEVDQLLDVVPEIRTTSPSPQRGRGLSATPSDEGRLSPLLAHGSTKTFGSPGASSRFHRGECFSRARRTEFRAVTEPVRHFSHLKDTRGAAHHSKPTVRYSRPKHGAVGLHDRSSLRRYPQYPRSARFGRPQSVTQPYHARLQPSYRSRHHHHRWVAPLSGRICIASRSGNRAD